MPIVLAVWFSLFPLLQAQPGTSRPPVILAQAQPQSWDDQGSPLSRCSKFKGTDPQRALAECSTAASADPENASLQIEIGDLHRRLGDRSKAEAAYRTSISLGKKHGEDGLVNRSVVRLAGLKKDAGAFVEAENLYLEAQRGCERTKNSECLSWVQIGLADIHIRRGYMERARPLLEAAFTSFNQRNDKSGLARTYYMMREIAKHDRNKTLWCEYGSKARALLLEIGRADVASQLESGMRAASCSAI